MRDVRCALEMFLHASCQSLGYTLYCIDSAVLADFRYVSMWATIVCALFIVAKIGVIQRQNSPWIELSYLGLVVLAAVVQWIWK